MPARESARIEFLPRVRRAARRDVRVLWYRAADGQQALTLASGLGMRPLVAHCHGGLAKLHRRVHKPTAAQEHFTTATTTYRDMGMTYWVEQLAAPTSPGGLP